MTEPRRSTRWGRVATTSLRTGDVLQPADASAWLFRDSPPGTAMVGGSTRANSRARAPSGLFNSCGDSKKRVVSSSKSVSTTVHSP